MWHTTVVVLHIVGAVGALVSGFLALLYPNGTPLHHLIGKLYLASWAVFAPFGVIIGTWHPGISIFEVLNVLGFVSTVLAYSVILLRKRIGRTWLRWHYTWMVTSLAFVCVATVNQILPRLGIEYPLWVFIAMALVPFPVNTLYIRKLNRRYNLERQSKTRPAHTA